MNENEHSILCFKKPLGQFLIELCVPKKYSTFDKMIREFELSLKSISQCQEARRRHHKHLMRELVVVLVRMWNVKMTPVVKMPIARYI